MTRRRFSKRDRAEIFERAGGACHICAKADRLRAKHTGTWPKSRAPLRSRGFAPTRGTA